MPFIERNGARIYYEQTGSGPGLLFLHSLGSGAPAWRLQVQAFQAAYRVVTPDLRAHGRSTDTLGADMVDMAEDMASLISALGLMPAVVVGLSMGGVVAQLLTVRHPHLVRALVLADTFCYMPADQAEERTMRRLKEMDLVTDMEAHARKRAETGLLPTSPAEAREDFIRGAAAMSVSGFRAAISALYRVDLRNLITQIRKPTLVLIGEHDQSTPRPLAEEIASRIPGAELQVVSEAGHLSNLDNPQGFNTAIDRFLEALGRDGNT